MPSLPETIDQRPNLCGFQPQSDSALRPAAQRPVFLPDSHVDFGRAKSAFAIALHMHQPLIPAGGNDLSTAEIIDVAQLTPGDKVVFGATVDLEAEEDGKRVT